MAPQPKAHQAEQRQSNDGMHSSIPPTNVHNDRPDAVSQTALHASALKDLGNSTARLESQQTRAILTVTGAVNGITNGAVPLTDENFPSHESADPIQHKSTEEKMAEAIRDASVKKKKNAMLRFLPIDAFERIITRSSVLKVLTSLKVVSPQELEEVTDQIWGKNGPSSSETSDGKGSRRKIFAILVLNTTAKDILLFIKENIDDNDLPFNLSEDSSVTCRTGDDGEEHIIQSFSRWPIHAREYFCSAQWWLLAPYFQLSTKDNPSPSHLDLDDNIVFPFIIDQGIKYEGGFSEISKIKIHPAHHNCCTNSASDDQNPYYALKRLRHSTEEMFRAEVSNLKRFCNGDYPHLIKLLATIKRGDECYLLFPWADDNLHDFWKRFPAPDDPKRDHALATWFSEQCMGLANGLRTIHSLYTPAGEKEQTTSEYQIHGRHGDLKPENILWFKSYDAADDKPWQGTLVISDFGLTRFHRTASKSGAIADSFSPTYRAPEFDVEKKVSQSYDVWGLGCVILEFITWYVLGWDEVDQFSKLRMNDHNSTIKEDIFFNHVKKTYHDGTQHGARFKESVATEFKTLSNNQKRCPDYMVDLLEFVETRLLRMSPKKRADCKEIVDKFSELNNNCIEDPRYCTHRTKPVTSSSTTLSELSAASLDLSTATIKILNRNSIPEHPGLLTEDSFTSEPDRIDDSESATDNSEPFSRQRSQASLPRTLGTRSGGQSIDAIAIAPLASTFQAEFESGSTTQSHKRVQFGEMPESSSKIEASENETEAALAANQEQNGTPEKPESNQVRPDLESPLLPSSVTHTGSTEPSSLKNRQENIGSTAPPAIEETSTSGETHQSENHDISSPVNDPSFRTGIPGTASSNDHPMGIQGSRFQALKATNPNQKDSHSHEGFGIKESAVNDAQLKGQRDVGWWKKKFQSMKCLIQNFDCFQSERLENVVVDR